MSIRKAGAIIAGAGGGGGNPDDTTINKNSNDKLQAIGTLNKNSTSGAVSSLYNWMGTLAEYTSQNIETLHPEWVCFITDDNSNENNTRNIGQIIQSTIPLTDAGLHLLDGALISGSGSYSAFVDYIAELYTADPTANYFAQPSTESEVSWTQPTLTQNGTMGGDSFACSASSYSNVYRAFNATNTENVYSSSSSETIIFYNPNKLKVTSIV